AERMLQRKSRTTEPVKAALLPAIDATASYEEKPTPMKSAQCDSELVLGRVRKIPAAVRHAVNLRDRGQCTYTDELGRCATTRWTDMHHVIPRSEGGLDTVENLATVCKTHHQFIHEPSRVREVAVDYVARAS
ncbi:MAG: HNH endonuclease signature motif containing protein, partial [Bdellovibrionota bacterium]